MVRLQTRWMKVLAWLSRFAFVTAGLLGLFVLFDPIGFRNTVFLPLREVSFFFVELRPFDSPQTLSRRTLPEAERIVLPATHAGDIDIVADLYRPPGNAPAPGVLLLHGSSVHGRSSSIIRLLGAEFQSLGWFALAPDARGFGDTGVPRPAGDLSNWRVKDDIQRALNALVDAGALADSIFVFGHSLGAEHALEGALNHSRVQKIALASPGIYKDGSIGWWQLVRFSADRRLADVLPENVVVAIRRPGSFNGLADGVLTLPRQQPLMLLYGLADSQSVLEQYKRISRDVSQPYQTRGITDAGHWFGVRSVFGSNTIYYREEVFDEFFAALSAYFESGRSVATQ